MRIIGAGFLLLGLAAIPGIAAAQGAPERQAPTPPRVAAPVATTPAQPADRCAAARGWVDAEATTPGILQRLALEELSLCLGGASQPAAPVAAGR